MTDDNIKDNASTQAPAPSANQARSKHIDVVRGTRLCTSCYYNLIGQPITREPEYDLLIARCPECGTVASMLDYPTLGRWAGRWSILLAAIYVFFLVAFIGGSSMLFLGTEMAMTEGAREVVSRALDKEMEGYSIAKQAAADAAAQAALDAQLQAAATTDDDDNAAESETTTDDTANTTRTIVTPDGTTIIMPQQVAPAFGGGFNPYTNDFETWWTSHADKAAIRASFGGWTAIFNRFNLLISIPMGLATIFIAMIWSIILIRRPLSTRLFVLAIITLLAILFSVFPLLDWFEPGRSLWRHIVAYRLIAIPAMIFGLVWSYICGTVGMIIGPRIARWFVRLLLPPSLTSPLAILWTADGLKPPGGIRSWN